MSTPSEIEMMVRSTSDSPCEATPRPAKASSHDLGDSDQAGGAGHQQPEGGQKGDQLGRAVRQPLHPQRHRCHRGGTEEPAVRNVIIAVTIAYIPYILRLTRSSVLT